MNTIAPGGIGAKRVMPQEILDAKIIPQIPVWRLARPKETADMMMYPCWEDATFVTGANIEISRGEHMQLWRFQPVAELF